MATEGNDMNSNEQSIVATVMLAMLVWTIADRLSLREEILSLDRRLTSVEASLPEDIARLDALFVRLTNREQRNEQAGP